MSSFEKPDVWARWLVVSMAISAVTVLVHDCARPSRPTLGPHVRVFERPRTCSPAFEDGLLVDGFVASDAEIRAVFPGWSRPDTGAADAPRRCWSLLRFPSRGLVEVLPWEIGILAEALGRDDETDTATTTATTLAASDHMTIMIARVAPELVHALAEADDTALREAAVTFRTLHERECEQRRGRSRQHCLDFLRRRPIPRRLATFRRLARDAEQRGRGVWLLYDD